MLCWRCSIILEINCAKGRDTTDYINTYTFSTVNLDFSWFTNFWPSSATHHLRVKTSFINKYIVFLKINTYLFPFADKLLKAKYFSWISVSSIQSDQTNFQIKYWNKILKKYGKAQDQLILVNLSLGFWVVKKERFKRLS